MWRRNRTGGVHLTFVRIYEKVDAFSGENDFDATQTTSIFVRFFFFIVFKRFKQQQITENRILNK